MLSYGSTMIDPLGKHNPVVYRVLFKLKVFTAKVYIEEGAAIHTITLEIGDRVTKPAISADSEKLIATWLGRSESETI
jgi:hypothetical protein